MSNSRIAKAFSLQLILRAAGLTASILTVTITTRYLGPSSYGLLTTAIVFTGLWASLTELGIGPVLVRRVTSGRGSLDRLVRVNAGMSIAYCVPLFLVSSISGAFTYRHQRDIVMMTLIIAAGLIMTTIGSCFEPIFLAKVRFGAIAVADLLSRVGNLAATAILVHMHAGLVWFAVVQLVPPAVILFIQGIAASRYVKIIPIFSASESWDLLRESLPQTAVLIIGVLYWRIDGVILSLRSSAEQVGIYGLAVTLGFQLTVLATFFQSSTLSNMTLLFARDQTAFGHFVAKSIQSMLFAAMPIAIGGAILSAQVMKLVGSERFVEFGGPTLALIFIGAALTFLTGALSQALFAAHDQIFLMRLNIVNLLGNILLNVALTPHFGAIGAASALVFTETIGFLVANWRLGRRAAYRFPWAFMFRLSVPLGACAAIASVMRDAPVVATVLAGAFTYIAVNIAVGPVTVRVIRSALSDRNEAGDQL